MMTQLMEPSNNKLYHLKIKNHEKFNSNIRDINI